MTKDVYVLSMHLCKNITYYHIHIILFLFMSCLLDNVLCQLPHILFKVSNGVLLDEYRQNVDALNNSGALVSREKIQEEIVNPEEIEWLDTKVHLRRSSF